MRGFLSPRRSKPKTTVADEQGSDEKETHNKVNHRSSSTSSLNTSKSTTKMMSSRHQPKIAATNNPGVKNSILSSKSAPESSFTSTASASSRRTTKSKTQSTPSNRNGKGAIGSRSKPSVVSKDSATRKYFDSPNASPNHFPSSGKLPDPVLHNQLQHLSIDDGKDDIANNVLHTDSIPESVGSDTEEQNTSQSNTPTILFKIYEEIAFHRQGNSSIKNYFKNLKALWDEPAPTYTDLPQSSSDTIVEQSELMEREKLMQFLLGLNDSYSSLCSQILLLSPSPTVDEAYSLVLREQRSRKSGILKKNSM